MAQMCIKIITFLVHFIFIISYFSDCATTNCRHRIQTPNATTTFALSNPGVKDAFYSLNVSGKYYGMEAYINVWQPKVASRMDTSSVAMWVQANNIDIAGAGWMVAPNSYNDSKPRFTTFWTRDNFQRTGCINTDCPGFQIVDHKVANLGGPLNSSECGKIPQQDIHLKIYRDSHGNWTLSYKNKVFGYWPSSLFTATGLGFGAATMAWGGKVFASGEFPGPTKTEMGSGKFPDAGFTRACYIKNITVFDIGDNVGHSPVFEDLEPHITNPNCYDVMKRSGGNFATHMFLGGNGGNNPNCQ